MWRFLVASEIWLEEIAPPLSEHRHRAGHPSAIDLQGVIAQARSQYKDMLSPDGHLTHHLPTTITMSVPVGKYVNVIVACVPPPEPNGVHAVMWEVADAEELVDVALVSPDPVPARWRELHSVTQYPRLPD
jgi:hypothetical protein